MDRETGTLSAWLRGLWTRVLFPGSDPVPGRLPILPLALLLIVPALLLYPFLGFRLLEPDESRYAQIPREMLQAGDWVLPTLQGEPYLDKPPLFYWLVLLSYRAFGVHDWAARLVPALAVHLTLLAAYLFGRRSAGDRPAFLGTMALALSPGFLGMGRLLVLDGLLMLLVTVAVFAAWEAIRGERLGRDDHGISLERALPGADDLPVDDDDGAEHAAASVHADIPAHQGNKQHVGPRGGLRQGDG